MASATSEGAPATRRGWWRLGAGPRPRPCSGLGQCQAPPGPSGVPWQAQGVSSRGACEARLVGRGRRGRGGGRGGGARAAPPASCPPAAFLPGGPGRPLLQAVPDLQPQLHRVGQRRAAHPDLTVAPALQPPRYSGPRSLPPPTKPHLSRSLLRVSLSSAMGAMAAGMWGRQGVTENPSVCHIKSPSRPAGRLSAEAAGEPAGHGAGLSNVQSALST